MPIVTGVFFIPPALIAGWLIGGVAGVIFFDIDNAFTWAKKGALIGLQIAPFISFFLCSTIINGKLGLIPPIVGILLGFLCGLIIGGSQGWVFWSLICSLLWTYIGTLISVYIDFEIW